MGQGNRSAMACKIVKIGDRNPLLQKMKNCENKKCYGLSTSRYFNYSKEKADFLHFYLKFDNLESKISQSFFIGFYIILVY